MKNVLSNFAPVKVLVLALGAMLVLPAIAQAGEFTGKFTLTSQARWGTAVLAPGDYDFTLDSTRAPSRVVVRQADGRVVAILISMWNSGTSRTKGNSLELQTQGGTTFVSAVYLGDAETELHFMTPKVVVTREAKTPTTTMTASAH
jgi:hypothetical protein